MTNELESWPTKREAAQQAGVSVRTIERHIAAGRIEARPSKRGLLCNPKDVAALPRAATAVITPPDAGQESKPGGENAASLVAALVAMLSQLLQRQRIALPDMDVEELRFLTLEEAAVESGLSEAHLRGAIRDMRMAAVRDGRQWKVSRRALRRYLSEISDE